MPVHLSEDRHLVTSVGLLDRQTFVQAEQIEHSHSMQYYFDLMLVHLSESRHLVDLIDPYLALEVFRHRLFE